MSAVEQDAWDREVDLLVLGAGAGGMAAALAVVIEGGVALIVEKSDQIGGTAATSAGTVWIPGNRQSREAGWTDTVERARAYLDHLTGTPDTHGLREAYLGTAAGAIDHFAAHSDVTFVPCGRHPDYRDMEGAAVTGRALAPAPFDGRRLGADFVRVRPPIPEFMVLGGMMVGKEDIPRLVGRFRSWRNFVHAARLALRHASDRLRFPRGTRLVMGNALVARLYFSLRGRDVPVLFEATAQEIVRDETGAVLGAVIAEKGGRLTRIRTRRGVVIATGGFGHSGALRKRFMRAPAPAHTVACPTVTGDGIELGLALGAFVEPERQGPGAFWTPVSVTRRAGGAPGVFPHLSLDRAKPGLVAVDRTGRRFVDEAASYHDFVEAMFATPGATPAHLICDSAFVARYGIGVVHPGTTDLARFERAGYLTTAPTLTGLAERLGLDPTALAETVARHNGFARTGRDLDFGKGETELGRFNGDPSVHPNPCLAPIETGPFVAVTVWPAEIGTATGLVTDRDGRVLDASRTPVPGLYACGNDMASVMEGTYPGPGTTLGPALTFAWRIARRAMGRPLGEETPC